MSYAVDRVALTEAGVHRVFTERVGTTSPAAAYAVFRSSELLYAGGIGGTDGVTAGADTAFRIASCTKSFTAAAALLLRDRGLLSLEDRLDAHLVLGPSAGHGNTVPTVGQLLSMAGGLPSDDPWADRQESLSANEFDAMLAAGVRFTRPPGVGFEYSNLGFAMVGRVLESVTGRPYVDLVNEEILAPLGLDGIGYDTSVAALGGVMPGCRRIDGRWVSLPFSSPGAFSPIGGLFATPRALARWAGWLAAATAPDAPMDEAILATASRREMQLPHTPAGTPDHAYGYGLVVSDGGDHGRIISHSGGYPGFGAHLRWHAETGIGIVAMENATYAGTATAVTECLTAILDAARRPDPLPELWPETLAAREQVESLLRHWDPVVAAALLAENVDLDDDLDRRRVGALELAAQTGVADAPIIRWQESSPRSSSPAHLIWSSPGTKGLLRCEISLTPQRIPLVQVLKISHA